MHAFHMLGLVFCDIMYSFKYLQTLNLPYSKIELWTMKWKSGAIQNQIQKCSVVVVVNPNSLTLFLFLFCFVLAVLFITIIFSQLQFLFDIHNGVQTDFWKQLMRYCERSAHIDSWLHCLLLPVILNIYLLLV